MRINKFIAAASDLSRRSADKAVDEGRVNINGNLAGIGASVAPGDIVTLDGKQLNFTDKRQIIMLNKPSGYVCSKAGQGSQTVYELIPENLQNLKTVGRLDKNSTGLILLTDDGNYSQQLTHPKNQKQKIYLVELEGELSQINERVITGTGIQLEDGLSKLKLKRISDGRSKWQITMSEGRNRQIRRTFAALNNEVKKLHRIKFGEYELGDLKAGEYKKVDFL